MAEHIYEESKYTVTATLKTGGVFSGAYSGKLDLYYCKNGDETNPLKKESDIDVNQGAVTREYTVPKVTATEDNYKFTIVAKYGKSKETTRVLADAVVWPVSMKAKFELKKSTGNVPLANGVFTIAYESALTFNVNGQTNSGGIATENLKKDLYKLTMKAPFEILEQTAPNKRDHSLLVRKNGKAKFYAPDITQDCYVCAADGGTDKKAGVRQYVNLETRDVTNGGADARGNVLTFLVGNVVAEEGLKDDEIFVKAEFTQLSKRNDPTPQIYADPGVSDVKTTSAGKVWTAKITLGADGEKKKFRLRLPLSGGEEVKVSVGYTEGDPTDDVLKFTTWRRVLYRMRFPKSMEGRLEAKTRPATEGGGAFRDMPASVAAKIKQRLDPAFVEFYNIDAEVFDPAPDGAAIMSGSFIDNEGLPATPIYVLDGSLNWAVGAPAFNTAGADLSREVHMTLCDKSYSSRARPISPSIDLTAADSTVRVDPDYAYHYFKKTPKAANTDNLQIAGKEWTAKMTGIAANLQKKKPTVNKTAGTNSDPPQTFTVSEGSTGQPGITVNLEPDNTLSATEKDKIKVYFEGCLTKVPEIRAANNVLAFTVAGDGAAEGAAARRSAVEAAITDIANASTVEIPIHPGLDDAGNPRKGPMSDLTITHATSRKLKFVLPADAPGKPGSFAGAASATKCPVSVTFTMDGTYEINGNAANGVQLLCMRETLPGPCASTILHELGHCMGMTIMPSTMPTPPGLTTPKNVDESGGTYYRDSGGPFTNGYRNRHAGPHCCYGMPSGKRADAKFNDWSAGASDSTCIMWGEGGNDDNATSFCTTCRDVIRARRLEDLRSAWIGRGDG